MRFTAVIASVALVACALLSGYVCVNWGAAFGGRAAGMHVYGRQPGRRPFE